MLFNHAGSYAEAHTRSAGAKRLLQNPQSLLTDRGAYLTYLESQLERVTAACLTVGGFQDHINDVQIELKQTTHKIANVTKLVGLAQSFSEKVAEQTSGDTRRCFSAIDDLNRQFTACAENVSVLQSSMRCAEDGISATATIQKNSERVIQGLHQQLDNLREKHNADQVVLLQQIEELKSVWSGKMAGVQQENQQLRERVAAAETTNEQLLMKITEMEGAITQLAEENKDLQSWKDNMEQQLKAIETEAANEAQDIVDSSSLVVDDADKTEGAAIPSQQQESNQSVNVPVSSMMIDQQLEQCRPQCHAEHNETKDRWDTIEHQVSNLHATFAGFLTVYHQTQAATREEVKGVQKTQEHLEPMLERLTRLLAHMQTSTGAPDSNFGTSTEEPSTPQKGSTPRRTTKEADTSICTENSGTSTGGRSASAGMLKKDDKMKKKASVSFQDLIQKPWVPPGVVSTFVDCQRPPSTPQQSASSDGVDLTSISTIKHQSSATSSSDAAAATCLNTTTTTAQST